MTDEDAQTFFRLALTSEPALIWSSIASFAATTLVIYVPFLADAFEFEHISLTEYAIALGLAFLVIPIVEIIKFFQRKATAANAR